MVKRRNPLNDEKISPSTVTSASAPTSEAPMRKQTEESEDRDERIEAALEDFRQKKFRYLSGAAKAYGIPEATLRGRKNGRKSRAEVNETKQSLFNGEEKALVQWILETTKVGYPPSKQLVRTMAEHIRWQRVSQINDASIILVEYPPLGSEWVDRFIRRHKTLRTIYARRIDASRVRETTADALLRWLNTVQKTIEEYDVKAKNIYNMDESGFAIGSTQGACVIIDSRIRSRFQARPGRQEWVTVIECICGDGTVIAPLVIFRGANLNTEWLVAHELTPDWRFSTSNEGWTSDIHAMQSLTRCFEPATCEKVNGGYRLLILDGHGSHVTVDFINHCREHKILLLRLIPHTSHLCQPLDVGLFSPLKRALSTQIQPLIQTEVSRVRKPEWLMAFIKAHQTAFS